MALSQISGTTGIEDATITSIKLADFAAAVDLNGVELILDADQDTSISADTDDTIDIKIGGADDFQFTANTFTALAGSGVVIPDGGLTLGSTAVTSTAAELNLLDGVSGLVQADLTKLAAVDATATEINLIDGGTSRGTDALASGDGILINDAGTMKMTNVDTVKTFMQSGLSSFDPDGAVTINDTGADVDFRVEGSGEANALFVQGSDGNVGIGTSTPAAKLIVTDSTTGITTHIKNSGATPNNNDNGVLFVQDSSSTSLRGPLLNVRSDTAFTGSYFAGINVNSASSNTHALWINQGGSGAAINVVGGNIVIGTAGKGIDFSNQTASSATGATTTAEVLDHYEEGTFTFSGTTIAGSSGAITWSTTSDVMTYQKIGNRVFIQGGLTVASNNTAGGRFSLNGLPFTSSAGTENSSYSLLHSQVTSGTGSQASGFMTVVGSSSTDLTIQTYTGTGVTNDSAPIMAVSSVLWISGSYTT